MHQHLRILQQFLRDMDNNYEASRSFYEQHNKGGMSKYKIISDVLHDIEHGLNNHDCIATNLEVNKILEKLHHRYFQNQHKYCWPSHLSHFHMSMQDWINCPITCAAEIEEFVDKILGDK